jgi:hypothetical protein
MSMFSMVMKEKYSFLDENQLTSLKNVKKFA